MAYFNLDDYQTVQQRINLFWETYPDGRLNAELVFHSAEQFIVKTEVYRSLDDKFPATVDYAEERVTVKGVNATSALENCVTSSYGRAIADLGTIFSPMGQKPSREEMAKQARKQAQEVATKDYGALAESLALTNDLTALRSLYLEAQAARSDESVLAIIRDFADRVKQTLG